MPTLCAFCEHPEIPNSFYCPRCGGRMQLASPLEQFLHQMQILRTLIRHRLWELVQKQMKIVDRLPREAQAQAAAVLDSLEVELEAAIVPHAKPPLPPLLAAVHSMLTLLPPPRGAKIRWQADRLGNLMSALEAVQNASRTKGLPVPKKLQAWFDNLLQKEDIPPADALGCIYATPERWPTVAAALSPEDFHKAEATLALAQAAAERKAKNYGNAERACKAVLARDPQSIAAHEALAFLYRALGQTADVVHHSQEAVRLGTTNPITLNNLAWDLASDPQASSTQLQEALASALRAVELAPVANLLDTLARVHHRLKDHPAALAAVREGFRADPLHASLQERRREILADLPAPAPVSQPTDDRGPSDSDVRLVPRVPPKRTKAAGDSAASDEIRLDEELRLAEESSAVDLGAPLAPTSPEGQGSPADSGISLESSSSDAEELAFDLTVAETEEITLPKAQKEPAAKQPEPEASSEFELTLDDAGGLAGPVADCDTDLESSDFELALDEEGVAAEGDTGSEVIVIDEDDEEAEEAPAAKPPPAVNYLEEDEALEFDQGSIDETLEENTAEESRPARTAATERPQPAKPLEGVRRTWMSWLGLESREEQQASPSASKPRTQPPCPITDKVHFSLTAPAMLKPGTSCILDVWAHLAAQRAEVLQIAREAHPAEGLRVQTLAGVKVARGTTLFVSLRLRDFEVRDPDGVILWDGDVGNARFPVKVPERLAPGKHLGVVMVSVNAAPIAELNFELLVGGEAQPPALVPVQEERLKSAFASYASEDEQEVGKIVRGIREGAPELELFWAVDSLRAGEDYVVRIEREINRCDRFYLFWSRAASQSKWVDTEWRMALDRRGLRYIKPMPLVSPKEVPPPKELGDRLHFEDWMLAFLRGRG